MEVFLARIRQLLPALGSDILAPIAQPTATAQPWRRTHLPGSMGAEARGQRTASGFVIFHDSTAVLEQRPSAESFPTPQPCANNSSPMALSHREGRPWSLLRMRSFLVHLPRRLLISWRDRKRTLPRVENQRMENRSSSSTNRLNHAAGAVPVHQRPCAFLLASL